MRPALRSALRPALTLAVALAPALAACATLRGGQGGGRGGAMSVECAIQAAALDSIFARRGARRIVLVDSTLRKISRAERPASFWRELETATGRDSAMVADFGERNASPAAVCREMDVGLEVTRVAGTELDSLPGRDPEAFWNAFRARYPGANGSVTLSRPGISAGGDRAILEISYACGSLCGEGMLVLLRREGGRWRVVSKRTMWVS